MHGRYNISQYGGDASYYYGHALTFPSHYCRLHDYLVSMKYLVYPKEQFRCAFSILYLPQKHENRIIEEKKETDILHIP